jgi:hypothetical protein
MSVAAPIDMKIFQDTVYDWFTDATDLFTIWRNQSGPSPGYPYAALQILNGPIPAAPQWETRRSTDLGRPAGEEVKFTTYVPCTFVISCQGYIKTPDARDPTQDATWYLNKAQSSLSLASVQTIFRAANIAYLTTSDVQNIPEIVGDAYTSRANIDVTFGATLQQEEFFGYINEVQTVSTTLGIDQTIVGG